MSDAKSVVMKDGRTVVFGKRQKCRKEVISDTQVRFDYLNGLTLLFDVTRCSPETARGLGLHGSKQKIGDEGSDEDTADAYYAKCAAMIDRLYAGTAFERQGGGGFQDVVLIEALVRVTKQSREEIIATLKTCGSDEKAALRGMDGIKEAIVAIEAERAKDVNVQDVMKKFAPKPAVEDQPAVE